MSDSTNNYLFRLYFGENIKETDTKQKALVLEQRNKKEGYVYDGNYFDLELNGVKFTRKVYEPSLIEAEISITRVLNETDGKVVSATPDMISKLLLFRRVELGIVNEDKLKDNPNAADERIAKNFYVYKLNPQMTRSTGTNLLTVKLTIYSMDKLMTIDKYSKCFTSKKLGSEILEVETQSFGFEKRLLYAYTKDLQHLKYEFKDDSKTSNEEFIHPYLVQYNESFYDFMVRSANRCGEFLYFENGRLNLGVRIDTKNITEISDFNQITFQEYSSGPVEVKPFVRDSVKEDDGEVKLLNFETIPKDSAGFPKDIFPPKPAYNVEVSSDEFIYPIVGNKWTTFPYEMGFDPKYGSGQSFKDFGLALALSLISNELKNFKTSGIGNAIEFAINCAKEWGVLSAKCFFFVNMGKISFNLLSSMEIDVKKNVLYMSKLLEKKEQADKKKNIVVAFSTLSPKGWTDLSFYQGIHNRELEQQQKMICIDMGTNYAPVQVGSTIKVNGLTDNYVVTEIKMVSDQKWTRNYKMFGESDSDIYSNIQSQIIYAIPTYKTTVENVKKEKVVPPMISAPLYRKAGPQTAFVVDSDDPKYQGRVRIVYPWQSTTEPSRVTLGDTEKELDYEEQEIAKIDELLAKLKASRESLNKQVEMIKNMAGMSEEEKVQMINELNLTLATDKARILELDIPGNTYDFDISKDPGKLADVLGNYAKEKQLTAEQYATLITNQAEVGRLKKEVKMLEAVLAAVTGSSQEDFDQLIAKVSADIKANEDSLNNLKNELQERKKACEEKQKQVQEAAANWSGDLSVLASPWVRIATPMATTGGGYYYKPRIGDEVLVNYDNDNIERPYVVGSLYSKNVQTPNMRTNITGVRNTLLAEASTYIMSPNGHHIVFNDPEDGSKLMNGVSPTFNMIAGAAGLKFEALKDMAGGIHLGDRYGLYELSMSAHDRKVQLRSPFGDVAIDAFTGITLNAPNGDIKISGKNISIEAGNNLDIKSGLNIQKPEPGHPTVAGKAGAFATGVAFGVLGGIVDTGVAMAVDMCFIRCFMEVMLRPIEGTMEIKSNRYMKLEAGMNTFAQIPLDRYAGNKKRNVRARNEIQFLLQLVTCIQYLESKVNGFVDSYETCWNAAYDKMQKYQDALLTFLNDESESEFAQIALDACKGGWFLNVNNPFEEVVTKNDFNGKIKNSNFTFDGEEFTKLRQKVNKLVDMGNELALDVYELHKHVEAFKTLLDEVVLVDVDDNIINMLKDAFNNRKNVRITEWETANIANGQPTNKFLAKKLEGDVTDAFVGGTQKFKRAVAASFLAAVSEHPDYQLDASKGEGAGNIVANLIKNPLDYKAKGKFLHLHYTAADITENNVESDYHWYHLLDRLQKPTNLAKRKLFDSVFTPIKTHLQIDEFSKIHDREVWADRGYGTILMSDRDGETRVFDGGNFTAEQQATKGNWAALLRTLKNIR